MQDSASDLQDVEPPTTLGRDPDDPSQHVTFPEGALDAGCYVEGPRTPAQSALLHSWCVEWAAAGYGFCYVHPTGPEPFDLLARLPADRLEDVVWIDVDRRPLPPSLDIPWLKRVTIDLFDVPHRDHEAFTLDPVDFRVNSYLDALSEHPDFDWDAARVLSAMLPTRIVHDNYLRRDGQQHALTELRSLEESPDEYGLTPEEHRDVEIARYAVTGALDREQSPAREAGDILGGVHDPTPMNPLLGDTSYDIGEVCSTPADPIVLVTGNLYKGYASAWLRTHLLVAALCSRLREAAIIHPDRTTTFPLVVDGLDAFAVGEGELFARLLRETDELPLAPVLSGPDTRELPYSLKIAIGEYAATRVGVTAVDDPRSSQYQNPNSNTKTNTKSATDSTEPAADLSVHSRFGSIPAAERYLVREHDGKDPAERLCRLRTDQRGWLGGASDARRVAQPAVVPEWPAPRHDPDTIADAITRSLERHGTVASHLTEDRKAEARDKIRNHDRRR